MNLLKYRSGFPGVMLFVSVCLAFILNGCGGNVPTNEDMEVDYEDAGGPEEPGGEM